MSSPSLPSPVRRLLAEIVAALLGQEKYSPGRPEITRALARLGDGICRWLGQHPGILLVGGNPSDPAACQIFGFSQTAINLVDFVAESPQETSLHFAGFWRDRRLVLICFRAGLTPSEFDHFFHLVTQYAGKGLQLRSRLFEEHSRGHLPHVSMVFLEDLPDTDQNLSWSARVALGWLCRDLNFLSRVKKLPANAQLDWRQYLLGAVLDLTRQTNSLTDFFANLDVIAEDIDSYDKDELVFALLEAMNNDLAGNLCLELCNYAGSLQQDKNEDGDVEQKKRYTAVKWIARRLAEHMIEEDLASPEHYHALVLHRVLLYEEIPRQMRPRVASLQVLTSFLDNPQKYFAEVENSHSPEVLETRLWRILEMVPKLVQALRFDVARQVLDFSCRFGPTFELHNKPDIMEELMSSAADVFMETSPEQQAAFLKELPQMGRTGHHLLIFLADHDNRSVRRASIDALVKIGQPVIPVLFETLQQKQGWHYLRNMLLILNRLNAGGPKIENFFVKCCQHPEANVRKEALPGVARLLKGDASQKIVEALNDADHEVKKRAAACLGVVGISGELMYRHLAEILAARDCSEDLAIQIVASINQLKPSPPKDQALETALHGLLATGRLLGLGGHKKGRSEALKMVVIQALGFVGTDRSVKILKKMMSGDNPQLSSAAKAAVEKLMDR